MSLSLPHALLCVLATSCADRAIREEPLYDPAEDERTDDEIIWDFCELYFECRPSDVNSSVQRCVDSTNEYLWYSFVLDPDVGACVQARLEIYGCASIEPTCESFERAFDIDRNRCEAIWARFESPDCAEGA